MARPVATASARRGALKIVLQHNQGQSGHPLMTLSGTLGTRGSLNLLCRNPLSLGLEFGSELLLD